MTTIWHFIQQNLWVGWLRVLWLHWGPFDSFLTSVLKLWLWPCSDSWMFPLSLCHYSLFASGNTYLFTLYLATNSSCAVFNTSFFSILLVLLWSEKGKQRKLSRYFPSLTRRSLSAGIRLLKLTLSQKSSKLQSVILFLYLHGCFPTGAITQNTWCFSIGKLQMLQSSDGMKSPCNIAYHCPRRTLLT